MTDGADILANVCAAIEDDRFGDPRKMLSEQYPFIPLKNVGRNYSVTQKMRVFRRDGFIDRYTGKRLIFPGTLLLISLLYPTEFPYHRNWKTDECHFAFWELVPTIDHLVPVSRGGSDDMDNWVCTSMARNAAKANFSIEDIGWTVHPAGDPNQWDGLTAWFLRRYESQGDLFESEYLKSWAEAAMRTMPTASGIVTHRS